MKRFSIQVDLDEARLASKLSASGSIRCRFYILVDGPAFPSDDWFDFPVVVLGWWLESCHKMYRSPEPLINSFMDGPFEFVSSRDNDRITLTFRKRTAEDTVLIGPSVVLAMSEYRDELVQVTRNLLCVLDRLSASGHYIDELRATLADLCSAEDTY